MAHQSSEEEFELVTHDLPIKGETKAEGDVATFSERDNYDSENSSFAEVDNLKVGGQVVSPNQEQDISMTSSPSEAEDSTSDIPLLSNNEMLEVASTQKVAKAAVDSMIRASPPMNREHEKFAEELQLSVSQASPAIKLLTSLSTAVSSLQQQQQMQQSYNARMNNINLLLNMSNYTKNTRLAKRQAEMRLRLEQGEEMVRSMEAEIDTQRKTVVDIRGDVHQHEQTIQELEESLAAQRRQVRELSIEYQQELASQRRMIESQQQTLSLMQSSKLKQDAIVDGLIMLLSLLVVKSPVVDLPLRIVLGVATSLSQLGLSVVGAKKTITKSRIRASSSILRVASFVVVARAMRILAMKRGIHNFVGTTTSYMELLTSSKVQNKDSVLKEKNEEK